MAPTLSLNPAQAGLQITRDNFEWGFVPGNPVGPIGYGFRASPPGYESYYLDANGFVVAEGLQTTFSRFNASQIDAANLVMQLWGDVANISFQRVGSGSSGADAYTNNATILFGNYSNPYDGSGAFAYYANPFGLASGSEAGDVWINAVYSDNTDPGLGEYGFFVLLHEVGHALGLQHPEDYNAGPGVAITYDNSASYIEDTHQYTVMSYFGAENSGANHVSDGVTVLPVTPLLHDIAALQRLYGANMTTRTGDTIYGFNSNADRQPFHVDSASEQVVFAVWDAGGNDAFDFSGYATDQLIDINAGAFSSVGALTGNVAIALNVVIENAVGGSGNDSIIGNQVGNSLVGGGGNDVVFGRDGDDALVGGTGNDRLYGDAGNDVAFGQEGDDVVFGAAGNDFIQGNAGFDALDGGDGADVLDGGDDNDLLTAGAGADVLVGQAGEDDLRGEDGNDTVFGGDGSDHLLGAGGNDYLEGGVGDDTQDGGFGDDVGVGNAGNDLMLGASGNDVLVGQDGGDQLYGGDNDDTVIGGPGEDRVFGEQGKDFLEGDDGDDLLDGGAGDDVLDARADNDTLYGGGGNDVAAGGDGNDVIGGGDGNDTLLGQLGADVVYGDEGNDFIDGSLGNDLLYGGNGNDVIDSGLGANVAYGGAGDDVVVGRDGDDLLFGEAGHDTLLGGLGNDRIFGGSGNDYIEGGGGLDELSGGDGDDIFVLYFGGMAGVSIVDFTGLDQGGHDFLGIGGFGPGASLTIIDTMHYQASSADGLAIEILTFSTATVLSASDYVFL